LNLKTKLTQKIIWSIEKQAFFHFFGVQDPNVEKLAERIVARAVKSVWRKPRY